MWRMMWYEYRDEDGFWQAGYKTVWDAWYDAFDRDSRSTGL